jgi:hypothetical protein
VADLIARLSWAAPLLLADEPVAPASRSAAPPREVVPALAVLEEAAWLGATAAEALSPAGAALLTPGDVAAAVAAAIGSALGEARATARLQGDLTAVVLGEPSAELTVALDAMADRENRSTASVWRFTPASVRRAMDAGADADVLLTRLTEIAEGPVPQPLEYLLRDVARRHGALRGAGVHCYLRSDDAALLRELVADRKLRKLGLRQVAPTVVVGDRPLTETLEALRAAGHAPVEEGPDGATIVAVQRRHRAASSAPPASGGLRLVSSGSTSRSSTPHPAAPNTSGRSSRPASERRSPESTDDEATTAAARLLAGRDQATGTLIDVGTTVVDLANLRPREGTRSLW